jgi:hypothetical protein
MSTEEILGQLKTRTDIKVSEIEKNILILEYANGKVLYKNISDYRLPVTDNLDYSPTYDSTIIDLTTIDTSLFYDKYKLWQEVLIANIDPNGVVVGDINNNSRSELYGFVKDYTSDYSDIVVKELNENGTIDSLHNYENTTSAVAIYDVNKDGNWELHLRREEYDTLNNWPIDNQLYFNKETDTSLAFNLSFIFLVPGQSEPQLWHKYYDLDGDEFIDVLYINNVKRHMRIYEYNPVINNFDSIYSFDCSTIADWFEGFAVDDFDEDGKSESFIGGSSGQVIGFESNNDNSYIVNWVGQVATNNAFLFAVTNDVDGNGKKEFWIGGDSFNNGVPITRLTCFEAVGNNTYEAVARIDIIGFFSFYAFNMLALDVDKDGVDELILCLEQTFIILEFNGSSGNHSYAPYYIKQNERALNGKNSVYWNATMYDIDSDNKEEILITADHVIENLGIRFFTQILKRDRPDNVDDEKEYTLSFELFQNYPNPFNSTTQVKFELQTGSSSTLKVYNILGKEIATLLDEYLPPGKYSVNWEAKGESNNSLPSSIYFIKLSSGNFIKTIKAVLLK